MRASLSELLATGRVLLADGATGTNYFAAGLMSGDPPEFWTVERPETVMGLHRQFIDLTWLGNVLAVQEVCEHPQARLHSGKRSGRKFAVSHLVE